MAQTVIIGTGSKVPSRVVTNADLEKMVDTTDEWITTRSGIKERRIVTAGETNSYLATEAARRALEAADLTPQDISLIIVATMTPDMPMPSVACLVQKNLGAIQAGAFDISATCSGFLYALTVADRFIKADPRQKILVIGSEVLSAKVNWQDRTTCVLFGDGAGAVVVTGSQEGDRGILTTHLRADGSLWELLTLKGCGSRYPIDSDLPREEFFIRMNGREVFKNAVRAMESVALETLAEMGLKGEDLDLLITHQANIRIIEFLRERLAIPAEKVFINIHKYGNTSAASIPLALDEAVRTGRLKEGDLLLMVAFGGGFTWASVLMKW
ncbi:ketoacyl-ACP synthase III [Thermosulfuriphilus ammonigenes]|uniref:Beta-ketoacyl-[acyl-carrier-protein] synthase III n=1 Tax=Thermosulfuriphilus ammonigenes TaxID=1936021 RepID=A0A6G7PXE6_9BACT|nr:beta-ketoacyl-ACP synthase III [Thermosulfuriphilus ammonigenes]MBA2849717.1 3-oxoacyl-[acyl-carrier-protein] synthase-3 [Thermosulfuriphilus ammonigenes]QIJ72191.1 ketoacyl-ACP synthase III [Thermosulfuriphilus ammonigenes]